VKKKNKMDNHEMIKLINKGVKSKKGTKKSKEIRIFFLLLRLIVVFLIVFFSFLYAEEKQETKENIADSTMVNVEVAEFDSLDYQGNQLYYLAEEETIILYENSTINYGSSTIKADSMRINFQKNQARAFGRISMSDDNQLILGSSVFYDLESETGYVLGGASRFDLGYYYGDEIRKVGDEVYDLDLGRFTTCDALHPHFDFRSSTLRMYRDHMIVGRPIWFTVNEMPILWLPYGAFSIKSGRTSGFLTPAPGYSQGDGKKFENLGYFFVLNDYSDVTGSVDLLEKTGYNFRLDYVYLDRYRYRGGLDSRYLYRTKTAESHSDDWYVKYRHFQNLAEKATFVADVQYASKREVFATETDPNLRLVERISSNIAYTRPLATSSFYASSSYTDDLLNKTKSIELPRYSYSMPSKPVHEFITAIPDSVRRQTHWWKNFSFSWSTAGIHTGYITDKSATIPQIIYENQKDTSGRYTSEHHVGMRQNGSLSWNYTFLGWLKLTNSLSGQHVLHDRDRAGHIFVQGYSYNTVSTSSFTIYGVGQYPRLPIRAVRHILTPSASFRYSPDFQDNSKLYSFGGMGLSSGRKARSVNLSLDQRWQFKLVPDQAGNERKLNDLIALRSSISFDLEYKNRPSNQQSSPGGWSDISHTVSLNPGSTTIHGISWGINQNYSATQKPYEDFKISSYRVNSNATLSGEGVYKDYFPLVQNDFITGNYFTRDSLQVVEQQIRTIEDLERLDKPGSWTLTSGHDYSYDRLSRRETSNLRNAINFRITTNWSASYSNYHDLSKKVLISQSMNITRELHCWKILFTYTKSANFWDYRVILYNIKLPDSLKIDHNDSSRSW